jgi:hypothetical protein
MSYSGMLHHVAHVTTDISEELRSILLVSRRIFLCLPLLSFASLLCLVVLRLLVTADVPSSPTLVTLMTEDG